MPTSEARILANRQNCLKSTGPKTAEGKERSRRNGLKHGMTGQGIVISDADVAEVESRNAALQKELAPQSVLGAILVGQMATLSVRMERGATQEFAAVANRVRHATDDFDAERVARAEGLLKAIGEDPRRTVRQLIKSPEGIELMLEAWQDLRANLTRTPGPIWDLTHAVKMTNLLGLRDEDAETARLKALSKATWGNFASLKDADGAGLASDARQTWARSQLVERIDEEIARLEEHFVNLDTETIEADRAEAGARALFDPSKEASLARRYESEARRGFFRSLKEFRKVEAEAVEQAVAESPAASASTSQTFAPLASSWESDLPSPDETDDDPIEMVPAASQPVGKAISGQPEVDRAKRARALKSGRAVPMRA